MLLEFGARNFFSFREGFSVSFEVDGNCPKNISKGKPYVNVIGLKGANAAGKTNVLRALSFIRYLCTESYSSAPRSEIPFASFFGNTEETGLFCRFSIDNIAYLYEVELTKNEIISEKLSVDESDTILFERQNGKITITNNECKELEHLRLRNNVSVIHSAKQAEINSINKFFSFFNNIITNVTDYGLSKFLIDSSMICKDYRENPQLFEKVKKILKVADLGISDVKIGRSMAPTGQIEYYPVFVHDVNGKSYPVVAWYESTGTLKLFYDLALYYKALERGGVLLLDEFDINIHPALLPMLMDLFESDDKNPKNAQMIFSTHDTAVMDRLGKYRTYLVNKQNNESFGYRLDEIPGDILKGDLRNDRPISQWYRKGKLGGVPQTV